MPIALDKNVYYGNKSVVDSNTNMYKMRKSNLAMQLTKTGSSNIVWVDNDEVSDTLNYIYKPTSNISPNMKEYDGTEASVNERDFDKSLIVTFSGNVTVPVRDGSYKVKIYIDRNCDSMFQKIIQQMILSYSIVKVMVRGYSGLMEVLVQHCLCQVDLPVMLAGRLR